MLRVDLKRARPGMTLALPVQNPQAPARSLLKAGYALEDSMIEKLRELNIRFMWVRCPALDFIEKYLNREGVEVRNEVVTQVSKTFELMQDEAAAKLPYDAYTNAIGTLIDNLISNPGSAMFLGDLVEGPADLMRHSSTVTYLSLLLGLKLEGYLVRERRHVNPQRAKEVIALGVGAMLHDVGLTMLPEDLRDAYAQAGDDHDPKFREHTALGFRTVRGNIEPTAATIVLHHHQLYNGKGFTGKEFPVMQGRRIHVFARIAAVADAFDRLRCPPKLPQQSTAFVLSNLVSPRLSHQFDPTVLNALLDVVPPYAPGSTVKLSDGRMAVVIEHQPDTPCMPVVQVIKNPDQIGTDDMELEPQLPLDKTDNKLHIVECDGQNVAEYRFTRPEVVHMAA